jgi:hypothetical protein
MASAEGAWPDVMQAMGLTGGLMHDSAHLGAKLCVAKLAPLKDIGRLLVA